LAHRPAGQKGCCLRRRVAASDAVRRRVVLAAVECLEQRTMLSASPQAVPTYVLPAAGSTLSPPFTPAQIRTAYGINQITFSGGAAGNGAGQTIAIIDAYNDPDIVSDVSAFSTTYGLQPFNVSGGPTFTVVNQNGATSPLPANSPTNTGSGSWALEESLDVEWAHSVAPMANIMLFEANSANQTDLYQAVQTAANTAGVSVVSMSFYGAEFNGEQASDGVFTTPAGHAGVTFFASTGDLGSPGGYPASSPNVVAVGGTTLTINSDGSYGGESAWSDSGGNISDFEPQPTYQSVAAAAYNLTERTTPDVSWDADPDSGVDVIDTYDAGGTVQVGGTSLSCPMWAALTSIIDQGRALAGKSSLNGASQTLPLLYSLPSSDFNDITTGNNGYPATVGYDLATGLGTPVVNSLVNDMVNASVVYVDAAAPGTTQNGQSWSTAYTTLPQALSITPTGLEVIDVGQGAYFPAAAGSRSATFQLQNNVVLEGGYEGYGANAPDMSGAAYPTILSGAIGAGGNSYHVVTGTGTNATAVLDGFTITSGNADGSGDLTSGFGGGLYVSSGSPTIVDCAFENNLALTAGAGIYDTASSPTLLNVTFTGNSTSGNGGGVADDNGSSPTLTDCIFNSNAAADGGGMYNGSSCSPTLGDCVFVSNSAVDGGALYTGSSTPTLNNCTITANTASVAGGAAFNGSGALVNVNNSILWGDTAPSGAEISNPSAASVSYSDVSGGFSGLANVNANPLFVASPGNLELEPYSPCVNVGNPSAVPAGVFSDLAGFPRQVGRVDLGAYECQVIYVDAASTSGGNNGSSWANAYTSLSSALSAAKWGEEIYVAGGTYVPGSSLTSTFDLKDNVSIFGGYAGIAASNSYTVNYTTYATTLSGAVGSSTKAYHVVTGENTDSTITLSGLTITGGDADGTATSMQNVGGGLYGGSPNMINCTFTNNTATSAGGAAYLDSNLPTLTNCTFTSNSAENGGAVYDANVSPTFIDCTFTSNSASGGVGAGGAISSTLSPTLTLTGCTLRSNTASGDGGGLYFANVSSTVTACVFNGNSAPGGGAVYSSGQYTSNFTNSVFDANTSTSGIGGGAGIDGLGSGLILVNCTFTANAAKNGGDGGAINIFGGGVTLTNCILWNDSASSGDGVHVSNASAPIVTYSDDEDAPRGTGNIDVNPLFVSVSGGNLQLQETSPCINAGSNAAIARVTTDAAGNPRIVDGTVDMGAYEAQLVAVTWTGAGDGTNWNNSANWSGKYVPTQNDDVSIPTGVTLVKIASGSFSAHGVTSQSPIELTSTGTLTLYGTATFTGGLTIDNGGTLQIGTGGAAGSASGNIVDNGSIITNRSDSGLSLSANISGAGSFTDSGIGTVTLLGSNSYTGLTTISSGKLIVGAVSALPSGGSVLNNSSLLITAGSSASPVISGSLSGSGALNVQGYLRLAGSDILSQQSTVTIGAAGTLDIGSQTFIINYLTDPIATIQSYLQSGYAGGAWNGLGIVSSSVAAENASQSALIYAVGYADGADGIVNGLSSGQIEMAPTLAGDAKLQGDVVFGDFQLLSQYFGQAGGWDEGNFTYGSTVTFGDFQLLSQNFGQSSQFSINASEPSSGNSGIGSFASAPATKSAATPSVASSPSLFSDQLLSATGADQDLLSGIVQTVISL
jgi:autotransporter-associated beta strand protein/predicted outer membrane repeat protein